MKIKFIGAANEVTGSKHLIVTEKGKKLLLDCGMFQGKGLETDAMNRNTMIEPSEVDCIILTHAHIDHSGLIPYFYKRGFRGSVICTTATRELCSIMLPDSGFIQENDTHWFNKKRSRQGLKPVEPIYTEKDARECMELFITTEVNRRFYIDNNISVKFYNTGHMLGSACATIRIDENGHITQIGYTGDIGRYNSYLLKAPNAFPQCDYLITESTYGDRLHKDKEGAEDELLEIIRHTCVEKKGKLIIPSFAIGRTQEIVYILNNFYNAGLLPKIPVFVDSPLATNATTIFKMHLDLFNKDVAKVLEYDDDPFGFNSLRYITDVSKSKALNEMKQPCIIISSSGMMEAGRVKHHLANNIDNPKNSVLSVGYCAPTTLGARIVAGEKDISIFGMPHKVNADVYNIDAFSGHGDYKEMAEYLKCQNPDKVKKVFIVHGEKKVQERYAKYLKKNNGFKDVVIPEPGETFKI